MRANDIRRTFLDFYQERGHKVVPSASLIPDDPNLLLTIAGMVPFKPYLEGRKPVEFPRAVSVQKSARMNDIENVGVTARHQTVFEMLGNFSFGDYFKSEAIAWAWELSIGPYGLDPDRIWVTVYEKDDEAVAIWRDEIGLPAERIVRRGAEDNLWWMGVPGPGGPCSELFYDRGPAFGEVNGFEDGDRIMEYYNLVFTEFQMDASGVPVGELPRKNVDTGSGLERVAQILQEVPTAYETDLFKPIVERAEAVTGRRYGANGRSDVSLRILAEHARSAMFLIGDGVLPSNEGRGYILRRLIRRAVRHAKLLGTDDAVMADLIDASIMVMGEWYPEVASGRAFIQQVASAEADGFRNTLRQGLTLLDTAIHGAKKKALGGDVAFKLHDTYGFPFELTLEIASEAGLEVDRTSFEHLMGEQRDRARAARKAGEATDTEALREILVEHGASRFSGYDRTDDEAKLLGLVHGGARVASASEGDEVEVVLDASPFYPEGGGQVGDSGVLEVNGARIAVEDTQRVLGDLIVHHGKVIRGEVNQGTSVRARVDAARRAATQRSHTATHILHATLRAALGDHARQAGSLVDSGRLRFDFSHFDRVPHEVLDRVESEVNARLVADESVRPYETTMEEARNRGAIMLFEEKYGDIVRVVEIGDYSVELCGGIHVTRTSQVGAVKLLGEASIGSNLRRIEALTGADAIAEFRRSRAVLEHIALLLKTSPEDAPVRVERLLRDLKAAESHVRKAAAGDVGEQAARLAADAIVVGGAKLVVGVQEGKDAGELQALATAVREKLQPDGGVILVSSKDGRASVVCALTKGRAAKATAATLITDAAKVIGGGAGGRPEFATGGGGKPEGVHEAARLARAAVEQAWS